MNKKKEKWRLFQTAIHEIIVNPTDDPYDYTFRVTPNSETRKRVTIIAVVELEENASS